MIPGRNPTRRSGGKPAFIKSTIGSGVGSLTLHFSQDVYLGPSQCTVSVDGVQVGGTVTVFANRATGYFDTLTVQGTWAAGAHTAAVNFLNDAYGGSFDTDRNLYIDHANYNGQLIPHALGNIPDTTSFTFYDSGVPLAAPAGAVIASPGNDLQSLVNAAATGATFWLQPGTYRLQSIVPKNNQTFIGDPAGVILNGSRLLTGWTQSGSTWFIGGQTQDAEKKANFLAAGAAGFERPGYPDAVYMDDQPLLAMGSLAGVGPGKYYFDYTADRIYIGDNPAGRKIEAAVATYAFSGFATGVKISRLVVEKYATPPNDGAIGGADGMQDGWIANDVEARLNYGIGVRLSQNSSLINSRLYNNGEMGAGGGGGDVLVQNTEIAYHSGWAGIDLNVEGGGFKFAFSTRLTVRGCYSHDNAGNGMWTDICNINTLYEDNYLENNGIGGIFHEVSYDAIIRNNIVINCGYVSEWVDGGGIMVSTSRNVEIYGNTVHTNDRTQGITLLAYNRQADEVPFGAPLPFKMINANVHDNVVIGAGGNGGSATDDTAASYTEMWTGTNMFDYNTYILPDVSASSFFWNLTHYTFPQLQATGQNWEANGTVQQG